MAKNSEAWRLSLSSNRIMIPFIFGMVTFLKLFRCKINAKQFYRVGCILHKITPRAEGSVCTKAVQTVFRMHWKEQSGSLSDSTWHPSHIFRPLPFKLPLLFLRFSALSSQITRLLTIHHILSVVIIALNTLGSQGSHC